MKIAIIGFGSIGQRHLKICRELIPYAKILVLKRTRIKDTPRDADFLVYDIEDAIAFEPQIVIIANPCTQHLKTACRFAEIGCHLLIEKPLSNNSIDINSLRKLVNDKNIVCKIGYNLRHSKSLCIFKDLVMKNIAKDLQLIKVEASQYLPDWRPLKDYRDSVSSSEELGGGVLLELSHEFDYIDMVFGQIAWVSAWHGNCGNLDISAEDTALITAGINTRYLQREVLANIVLNCSSRHASRYCIAIGNDTSLKWDGIEDRVEVYSNKIKNWKCIFQGLKSRDESYKIQFREFITMVNRLNFDLEGFNSASRTVSVVEAVKHSTSQMSSRVDIEKIKSAANCCY